MTENNITFYVKYGEGRAISVKTHYCRDGSKRENPLITVEDLIDDFNNISNSPLVNVFVGNITLHTTENGVVNETPLDVDKLLSSLPSSYGRKAKNPFVLKIIGSTQPTSPTSSTSSSNNTSKEIDIPLQQLSVSGKLNLCFFSYFIFTLKHWSLCLLIFLKSHTLDVHTLFSSVSNE